MAVTWITACGPSISQQLKERNIHPIPFGQLVGNPQNHQGQEVILGGYVLQTGKESGTTQITILQAPLDSVTFEPKAHELSEGRFLVSSQEQLAPDDYSRGRSVTVLGNVSGISEHSGSDNLLIQAEKIYLWPKPAPIYRYHSPYGRK
jgi:outer membrane lipoprotein